MKAIIRKVVEMSNQAKYENIRSIYKYIIEDHISSFQKLLYLFDKRKIEDLDKISRSVDSVFAGKYSGTMYVNEEKVMYFSLDNYIHSISPWVTSSSDFIKSISESISLKEITTGLHGHPSIMVNDDFVIQFDDLERVHTSPLVSEFSNFVISKKINEDMQIQPNIFKTFYYIYENWKKDMSKKPDNKEPKPPHQTEPQQEQAVRYNFRIPRSDVPKSVRDAFDSGSGSWYYRGARHFKPTWWREALEAEQRQRDAERQAEIERMEQQAIRIEEERQDEQQHPRINREDGPFGQAIYRLNVDDLMNQRQNSEE